MHQTKQLARKILFIVTFMTLLLGLGIDLYSPSFPDISRSFKTTEQLVQLTIATYFFGYVIGLVFLGPISDIFGRKKPLIFGMIFYGLMSFLCAVSTTIETLLTLRFFQGIGAASLGVMFRSILSDVFTGKQLATALNYTSMSYRLSPIIAPFIGGYLTVYFGWPSNFYFLMVLSALFILSTWILLPETHANPSPFDPKQMIQRYTTHLRSLPFLGGAICIGCLYSIMLLFNIVGPFFIQNVLGFSSITYGHIALLLGIAAFFGILLNRFLIHLFPISRIIKWGIYALLVVGLLQSLFALIFPTNLYSFILPFAAIFFLSGFAVSNMMSQALESILHSKGTASALLGILLIFVAMIISALASFLRSATIRPSAFASLTILVLSFLCYIFLFQSQKFTEN